MGCMALESFLPLLVLQGKFPHWSVLNSPGLHKTSCELHYLNNGRFFVLDSDCVLKTTRTIFHKMDYEVSIF